MYVCVYVYMYVYMYDIWVHLLGTRALLDLCFMYICICYLYIYVYVCIHTYICICTDLRVGRGYASGAAYQHTATHCNTRKVAARLWICVFDVFICLYKHMCVNVYIYADLWVGGGHACGAGDARGSCARVDDRWVWCINTLQHTATHCNTLQYTVTRCWERAQELRTSWR